MSLFQALLADSGSADHVPQLLLINQQIGIMIWGQSNALGSTDGVAPTTSPINYQLPITSASIYIPSSGRFNTLQYPANNDGNLFGCELSVSYDIIQAIGRPIHIGKKAVTGAPLYNQVGTDNFSPDAAAGDRLIDDLVTVNVALKNRCALYGKTPFIISIWIGGEADSQSDATAAAIRTNYEATKAYVLANGGQIDAEIVSILNQNYANATPTQIATVRSELTSYCDETSTAYDLDMDAFPLRADNIHFTGPGQEAIGIASADIILDDIFGLGIETYPGSYSADAKTALKNYRDDIPTGYKDAIADFVDGLQTDGNLDNIVICQVRGMSNMESAMVDIMGRTYGNNNGGTHDPGGGVTYNGTSEYTDTRFQSNTDGDTRYTQNAAAYGWYIVDNLTPAGTLGCLGGSTSSGSVLNRITQGATQFAYNVNSAGGGVYTGETAFADGFLYMARRTAASGAGSTGYIKGSTVVDGDNVTSNGLGNRTFFEGARNNDGTADQFWAGKTGLFVVFDPTSFDYAAFETRVATLIADLAAL